MKLKAYFKSLSFAPSLGFAMSVSAIFIISYIYLENFAGQNYSSTLTEIPEENPSGEEIYLSDTDSSNYDEYEDEIQLTNGRE